MDIDMTDIHELKPSEYSDFISLWQEAFGDDEQEINAFTNAFASELKCFILTDSTKKAHSALTLFKMGELTIPKENVRKDVYVSYAICTSKLARGKGYGAAITNYAASFVTKNAAGWCGNNGISVLSPASNSLINFYKSLGYKPIFLSHQGRVDVFPTNEAINSLIVKTISPNEYNIKREQILHDLIHISLSINSLNYLAGYSHFHSFTLPSDGLKGIFITSSPIENEKISLDELLVSKTPLSDATEKISVTGKDYDFAGESIAKHFNASICTYNSPAFSGNDHVQAMLFIADEETDLISEKKSFYQPYFAFPFD